MEKVSTNLTKRCRKCGEDRDLSLFKYTLTKAQARAKGFTARYPVEMEGFTCNLCKPKPRPLSKLRKDELIRKVEQGDITDLQMRAILKEREENANARKKDAVVNRWLKERSKRWHEYLAPLRKEIMRASRMIYNASQRGDMAILRFGEHYVQALKRIDAWLSKDSHIKDPPSVYWKTFATDVERALLEKEWEELDINKRMKMNYPEMLVQKS